MATRKGLGKGLDLLIQDKVSTKAETETKTKEKDALDGAIMVSITKVEPNRDQPRKEFNEDKLIELSESVKQHGILQPLLVQKREDYYEIIAGERRWRAAKMAGLKEVPVIVKELSGQELVEIQLIENIQRENLNPIEEARAYRRLLDEFHLKQDQVAERVAKSRSTITNSMRLLKLNEKVQEMVINEMLTTGHARAILGIEDQDKQFEIAQQVFDNKLSVRETEKLVRSILNQNKKEKSTKKEISESLKAIYRNLEEECKRAIGTKVVINSKNEKRGKIEIEYYDPDQLDYIINLLKSGGEVQ